MAVSNDKLKKLAELQKTFEKKFGDEGSINSASSDKVRKVGTISTGIKNVDCILGGGWAKGRVVSLAGPESSGKSSVCLSTIADIQKKDPEALCLYIDAEQSFDKEYSKVLGVDLDRVIVQNPIKGETALTTIRDSVNSGLFSLVVLDSVNALSCEGDADKDVTSTTMGSLARLMSAFYRQIVGPLYQNNCTLIVIEQIREKIGVMFGNPETKGVGNAGKFYFSQSLDVRRRKPIEESGEAIANNVDFKVVKNKIAPPFRKCSGIIYYGKGFDNEIGLVDLATRYNIVEKSGAWYYYPNKENAENKWNGGEAFAKYLKEDKEFAKLISDKIDSAYNGDTEGRTLEKNVDTIDDVDTEVTE